MTNPHNLTETIEAAQHTITTTRDEVRTFIPALVRRLMLTFGPPLLVALLVSTIGAMLLSRVLPSSTTSIIAFGVNIAIMVYGWRFLERRYKGTSAFIVYTRYSRIRRDLEAMIKKTPNGSDISEGKIEEQRAGVVKSADAFIQVMYEMGAQPTSNR